MISSEAAAALPPPPPPLSDSVFVLSDSGASFSGVALAVSVLGASDGRGTNCWTLGALECARPARLDAGRTAAGFPMNPVHSRPWKCLSCFHLCLQAAGLVPTRWEMPAQGGALFRSATQSSFHSEHFPKVDDATPYTLNTISMLRLPTLPT